MRAAFSPPPRLLPKPAVEDQLVDRQEYEDDTQQAGSSREHGTQISPSLLRAADSTSLKEAQLESQLAQPIAGSTRAHDSPGASIPAPITPDQDPLKDLKYSSSIETLDGERLSARSSGVSYEEPSQQRRRSRQPRERGTQIGSDKRPQSSRLQKARSGQDTLGSDELEKISGQDSLEVRQINLGNGQVASLVLEEGRLQRIVSSNGQVAELQWQPPAQRARNQKASKPQLAVKMHRGVSPAHAQQSSSNIPLGFKRWANNINAQRLTSHSDYGGAIFTAPINPGSKARSSADISKVKSVDLSARQRAPRSSLLTAPAGKSASLGDLDIGKQKNREVKRDWNPMSETWLPQNMTAEQAAAMGRTSSRDMARKDAVKTRQSADSGLTFSKAYPHTGQQGSRSSFVSEPAAPTSAEINPIYATEGDISPKQKKKGIWSSIKRILSLPSSNKSHQSGSPQGSAAAAGMKRDARGAVEEERFGPGAPVQPEASRRNKSMSSARPTHPEPLPASEQKIRSRSTSARQNTAASTAQLADRLESEDMREDDATVPYGTSFRSVGGVRRNLAADLAVLDGGQHGDIHSDQLRRVTQLSDTGISRQESADSESVLSPTFSEMQNRQLSAGTELPPPSQSSLRDISLGSTGSLVDTNDLKTALSRRKSSQMDLESKGDSRDETNSLASRSTVGRRGLPIAHNLAGPKQTLMAGKWQKNFTEGTSGAKVDDLLHVSSLQRLARERIVEMQIVETDNTFELVWHIPLNGSASKISKTDRYLKNGEVVEAARRDGRPGLLRSQLTFTPEGHVHIRALQGEPYSAVFHDRIKLSTGGRRIKFEQKFQLLQPGVPPVKYFSIWHRIE